MPHTAQPGFAVRPKPIAESFTGARPEPSGESWLLLERCGTIIHRHTIQPQGVNLGLSGENPLQLLGTGGANGGRLQPATAVDGRLLICLAGMLTQGTERALVRSMLKFAAAYFTGADDSVQIAAAGSDLPFTMQELGGPAFREYREAATKNYDRLLTHRALDIARVALLPRMLERGADNRPVRRAVEDVCRGSDQVTLLAHCAGSVLAQEIANGADLLGRQLGFSRAEMRRCIAHLAVINVASMAPVQPCECTMTSISLQPSNDPISLPLAEAFGGRSIPGGAVRDSGRAAELLITGPIPTVITYVNADGQQRAVDLAIRAEHPEFAAHSLRLYRTVGVSAPNSFAQTAERAVRTLTGRNGRPSAVDLLEIAGLDRGATTGRSI